jgi:hypothetical protein
MSDESDYAQFHAKFERRKNKSIKNQIFCVLILIPVWNNENAGSRMCSNANKLSKHGSFILWLLLWKYKTQMTQVPIMMTPLRIYCISELRICCPISYSWNLYEVFLFNINACEAMQDVSGNICMLTLDREELRGSIPQHKFVWRRWERL